MERTYPKGHITRTMALDGMIFLIGLAMLAGPFVSRTFPGSLDTTDHVALGALIATLAIFRVAVAYGSIWIEVVLFVLGLVTFCLPRILHMQWSPHYNTGHLVGGGLIMVLSVLSAALTWPVLKQR